MYDLYGTIYDQSMIKLVGKPGLEQRQDRNMPFPFKKFPKICNAFIVFFYNSSFNSFKEP